MEPKKIKENIFWVGAEDWDRRLFDSLIPLPDGTSYNAYLIKGSEKTALLDTVDPSKTGILISHLEGIENIDYVISHHAEQDHSGSIPVILEKYKNARLITNLKGKELLRDLLRIPAERIITVADGESVSLGGKTLEFIYTPWVHWPETFCTYLREDKILFSCDMFGSHLATSSVFAEDEAKVYDAAKRYYAEVMMPFRGIIKKHIEKLEKYPIEMIAPSHGPVYRDASSIMEAHKDWVSDKVRNKVIIPYATMHGSTEAMVDHLSEALSKLGVDSERFNLAVTDTGKFVMSLVDAGTMVLGSPTVLTGAHPIVISAAFLANALKPKLKFASIIGSYGWGGKMAEQIASTISGLKVEMLPNVIIKGAPKEADFVLLQKLANEIAERHRAENII